MEELVRQRIRSIIMNGKLSINFLSKGDKSFQRKMNRQINEGAAITVETISTILDAFPDVSAEWLMRGEGKIYKNLNNAESLIGSNQGENNIIEYNNTGNVEVGNTINVSLPETGTQKIISSDGNIEISRSNSSINELEHKIEMLEVEVSHLKANNEMKDRLISSLERTINIFEHKH